MILDRETVGRTGGGSSSPVVALIGSQLQFSDRLLRLLDAEFAGPSFVRAGSLEELLDQASSIMLVILHEDLADLADLIDEIGEALPGARVAVACRDVAALRGTWPWNPRRRVSVLQINAQLDVWMSVFRLLLCGQDYIPAELVEHWHHGEEPAGAAPDVAGGRAPETFLTPRELQILPLIASGMRNKAIAGDLGLSENTVKLHTHNIFAKLGVTNRTGAAKWYLSNARSAS
ncbi:helix-turn-helix transcriptional regulator [Roseitranquillus sediminis]|uniref:helix-turn-helix transcriptional regulator n=1 Tax=Roseitranquillus sediminis TaxID=2809051 RepID=UPI001D0C766C|nr:response regulator transcription factor [Roseitranquillus sediminis]MBM9593850.1 response regulator transcription factor [Roseitranquillus sediminis]